jgi:abequosyltransferase
VSVRNNAVSLLHSRKLLSICIPTYNRAHYLPEALESLMPQLADDIELLVYDTGSMDGTAEFMEAFAKQHPDVRFFRLHERRGVDEALLFLLEESFGQYVWFFGSDDVLRDGAVDTIRRRILQARIRPALLYLNHQVVDDQGKLLIPSNLGIATDCHFEKGRACVAWLGLHLGYISACIFRRDLVWPPSDAREYIGSLWVGLHLNLRALSSTLPAAYIGTPLVRARRNPSNVYDYGKIFCRNATRVLRDAAEDGLGWFAVYRALNRTVRLFHWRFAVSRRCDNPAELNRAFFPMLATCYPYPWFWLLVVPVRLAPVRLVRFIRDRLRKFRERRNASVSSPACCGEIHS